MRFQTQESAIMWALAEGSSVSIDEDHHTLIDRGYVADNPAYPGLYLVLRRVETYYVWQTEAY